MRTASASRDKKLVAVPVTNNPNKPVNPIETTPLNLAKTPVQNPTHMLQAKNVG